MIFPQKVRSGDAFIVMVKGLGGFPDARLEEVFVGKKEGKKEISLKGRGTKKSLLIGVPLDARELILRVKGGNGAQIAGVRIRLLPRRVPVSRLRLPSRYLKPPERLLKRINRERRMLRSILFRSSAFWYPKGSPVMPLERYRKTTPFGAKRVINGVSVSPHSGVDMAAPSGTPVRAVFKGRVAFAGNLYYTGNTVVLDHGRGFYTLYAHLSSFSVRKGEVVGKGSYLGKVGSTGRATGPHLHFGIYVGGVKVDPLSIFKIPHSLWDVARW